MVKKWRMGHQTLPEKKKKMNDFFFCCCYLTSSGFSNGSTVLLNPTSTDTKRDATRMITLKFFNEFSVDGAIFLVFLKGK